MGLIGDYLKDGDHLTCDIASADMWVNFKVKCIEAQLAIRFDLKVGLSLKFGRVK